MTRAALDLAGQFDPRGHEHLGEDVAQVGLDRLGAQEERLGDLAVRAPVPDELGDLQLALRERGEPGAVALPRVLWRRTSPSRRSTSRVASASRCAAQVSKASAARPARRSPPRGAPRPQRLAREPPCTSALDLGAGRRRAGDGREREVHRLVGVPARERDPGQRARRDGRRERKPEAVRDLAGEPR